MSISQGPSAVRIFGREVAVWLALLAGTVALVSAFVTSWSPEVQGVINAVFVAGAGVLTALKLDREKVLPAVLGLAQAGAQLAVTFGLSLSAEQQSALLLFVAVVTAVFVRQNVEAPFDENLNRRAIAA